MFPFLKFICEARYQMNYNYNYRIAQDELIFSLPFCRALLVCLNFIFAECCFDICSFSLATVINSWFKILLYSEL